MKLGARRLRWPVAAALLLLVGLALAGLDAAESATPGPISVTVEVSSTVTGQALPAGFLGLSLEYSAIPAYLGRHPSTINPLFTQLVGALNPGQAPVLRIGGDSTDHTWWPTPGVVEPAGVSYTLTQDWLATVHRAAAQLHARLILGVNLAADSPQLAGTEARALLDGIGRRYVEALEIGNEPDAYRDFAWYQTRTGQIGYARANDWSEPAYANEFAEWAAALPDIPLAGPADAYPDWMSDLSSLIASEPSLQVATFHRYPLRGCGPESTGALSPTIAHLLAASSSAGLARTVAPFVQVAHAAGRSFRVDELNSASCGGAKGLSNTFASSLWIVDTLFNMASVGVDGVNIHTLPGAAYAPFSFTQSKGAWTATVNPIYYGMLLFRQAFPAGARLLKVATDTSAPVHVWSTLAKSGTVRTVVINEDRASAVVHLHLDSGGGAPVSLETLTAAALTATTGVRLGGRTFAKHTPTGVLASPRRTSASSLLGHYTISVPADSAMLVTS